MPLISVVGRRSISIRLLLTGMYILLTAGALSMVYPFALMVATATTNRADYEEFRLVPEYWYSDLAVFKKYLTDCVRTNELCVWFGRDDWFDAMDISPDQFTTVVALDPEHRGVMAADWRHFVAKVCPDEFKLQRWVATDWDSALALHAEYIAWIREHYGDEDTVNRAYEHVVPVIHLDQMGMPHDRLQRQCPTDNLADVDWRIFLTSRTPERTGILDMDKSAFDFARKTYGSVERLREQADHHVDSLVDVTYDTIAGGTLGDDAKREFFIRGAPFRFVRIDPEKAREAWRAFLPTYDEKPDHPLPTRIPSEAKWAGIWALFVQKKCPLEALSVVRPEESWWPFLKERYGAIDALNRAYGTDYDAFEDVRIPRMMAVMAYDDFLPQCRRLRWNYLTHNFREVFGFVSVHGHAMQVTATYIVLLIATTLTVNPLAAYALSRFRLRETHHILVFLLATMAFPGEVLMIPNLLLIKAFPIVQILVVAACLLVFVLLRIRLGKRLSLIPSATIALAITIFLAGYVVPRAAAAFDRTISVSLMNTFFALILPAMANGYGVFLLKGFFDSLPPELYEAGLIDGASELRMFWQITLPLCKPIMAVMALGAFTSAYGAFMHAFLVCQNPKMWTLMVFLYEFQQQHSVPMVMASLVIAALPTLVVFVFCQRVILRGIVIPTFK